MNKINTINCNTQDMLNIIRGFKSKMIKFPFCDFVDYNLQDAITSKYLISFISILFSELSADKSPNLSNSEIEDPHMFFIRYFKERNFKLLRRTDSVIQNYEESYLFSIINTKEQKEEFKKLLRSIPRKRYLAAYKILYDNNICENVHTELFYQHELTVQLGEYYGLVVPITRYIELLVYAEFIGNEPLIKSILSQYPNNKRLRDAIKKELPEWYIRKIFHILRSINNEDIAKSKGDKQFDYLDIQKHRNTLANYLYFSKIGNSCVDLILEYLPY
jgi:hypothetical protein